MVKYLLMSRNLHLIECRAEKKMKKECFIITSFTSLRSTLRKLGVRKKLSERQNQISLC